MNVDGQGMAALWWERPFRSAAAQRKKGGEKGVVQVIVNDQCGEMYKLEALGT